MEGFVFFWPPEGRADLAGFGGCLKTQSLTAQVNKTKHKVADQLPPGASGAVAAVGDLNLGLPSAHHLAGPPIKPKKQAICLLSLSYLSFWR